MKPVVSDSAGELAAVIASAVGSAALTIAGAVAERAALQDALTGHPILGAWEAWIGAIALFVGVYLLGYRECWPRLKRFLSPR